MNVAQKLLEKFYREGEGQHVWEMSNLDPQDTGLLRPMWVDDHGVKRQVSHSPYRVKVPAKRGELFDKGTNSISFYFDQEEPYIKPKNAKHDLRGKELTQIKEFIKRNRDLLIKYYQSNGRYTFRQMANDIYDREFETSRRTRRVVKVLRRADGTQVRLEPVDKGRRSTRTIDGDGDVPKVGTVIK